MGKKNLEMLKIKDNNGNQENNTIKYWIFCISLLYRFPSIRIPSKQRIMYLLFRLAKKIASPGIYTVPGYNATIEFTLAVPFKNTPFPKFKKKSIQFKRYRVMFIKKIVFTLLDLILTRVWYTR